MTEDSPEIIKHPGCSPDSIDYGFFTSKGGKSTNSTTGPYAGAYSSLNVGLATRDDPTKVIENIEIAYGAIKGEAHTDVGHLFINKTPYSNKVMVITAENVESLKNSAAQFTQIEADALVTNVPGIALGTVGADAHSIVLMDDETGICALIAGSWKGIGKGVYEKTVEEMVNLGAKRGNIQTVIGPGLAKQSNEFGVDTSENFTKPELERVDKADNVAYHANPEYAKFFDEKGQAPGSGKCLFDMPGLIACKVEELGLGKVHDTGIDTMKDERFFGARRQVGAPKKDEDGVLNHLKVGRHLSYVVSRKGGGTLEK